MTMTHVEAVHYYVSGLFHGLAVAVVLVVAWRRR